MEQIFAVHLTLLILMIGIITLLMLMIMIISHRYQYRMRQDICNVQLIDLFVTNPFQAM